MFAYDFLYVPSIILIILEKWFLALAAHTAHMGSFKMYTYLGQSFWFNWFGMWPGYWELEKLAR